MKRRAKRVAVSAAIMTGSAFYAGAVWAIWALEALDMIRDPRA